MALTVGTAVASIESGAVSVSDNFQRSHSAYSSGTTYSVGDIVYHTGDRAYRCIQGGGSNHAPPSSSTTPDSWWEGTLATDSTTNNWSRPTFATKNSLFKVTSPINGTTAGTSAATFAHYWSANSFANNQYARIYPYSGSYIGCAVRMTNDGCYAATAAAFDEGEGWVGYDYVLYRYDGATPSTLASDHIYDDVGPGDYLEIRASGTTISVRTAGGTQKLSVTDSTFSSGSAGICHRDTNPPNTIFGTWAGGDL